MVKKDNTFIWSDNWWIEESEAWFVDGMRDILFNMDLKTNKYKYIATIPNKNSYKFRLNPRCIKCNNDIFCFPDLGNLIWIYQLDKQEFQYIEIENPDKVRISIFNFWKHKNKIFAVASGLNKIIEINIIEKRIDEYHSLVGEKNNIGKSVIFNNEIYGIISNTNRIFQFNLETKKFDIFILENIDENLFTISFDGDKFWFSGYSKKIYIWDKNNNTIKRIDEFPGKFGIYNFKNKIDELIDYELERYSTPTFIDSNVAGRYIWFIPFQTNKIIHIDKKTLKISFFEIEGEKETKRSLLKNHMFARYLVEYLRDGRYIGLFSFKDNCIIEIDTFEMKSKEKCYFLDSNDFNRLIDNISVILYENNALNKIIFKTLLQQKNYIIKEYDTKDMGIKIYNELIK